VIDVHDLNFTYARSHKAAVRGLTFAVEPGEIFGFLGPSGAGKSTTQKILIGLLEGYRGSVRVRDKEVAAWTADDYERIGVSFEAPNHFLQLTGNENLQYFAALYRGATRSPAAVLEAVGLESDGNRRVAEYSKGMKGRLSIARCLLNNPDLIFLDEPTGGLDPVNTQRVRNLIRAERQAGATIFLTTHDMAAADELCDRVAFIVDGRIACIDAPRTLKLAHGERTVRVEYRSDGHSTHSDYPLDGLADNAGFQQVLREYDVQTIHTREATLADVFIRVTGRALV
jgi:fluoroquinolone transport system ATP-binding protein